MRERIGGGILLFVVLLFAASTTMAGVGNLYPSGTHYNLNIIGKNAEFACPAPDPITGYGNVVFVPETGTGSQIQMVSGSIRGKTALTFTELKVIDACAGFEGTNDFARFQLPPNANGYRVYARALAKPQPTNEWTMSMTSGLRFVTDETGTELAYIGLVTAGGFETSYQVLRLKGKPTTVPISDMFNWSGTVCYQTPPLGDLEQDYRPTPMCYTDANVIGTYDYGDTIQLPEGGSCPIGSTLTELYCHTYTDEQWVFNIADLVEYFWGVDTNGSKHVQIRFYPNP